MRDYQRALIKEVREATTKHKRILVQSATGSGKTVISSYMMKQQANKGVFSLFICHRRELVKQTSEQFKSFNIDHGIISSDHELELDKKIQVCSVLSLIKVLDRLPNPFFVIWDEAHHIAASTWSKIFNKFSNAFHIGLSATPKRLDNKGLGEYFDHIINGPSVRWLINNNYLANYVIYCSKNKLPKHQIVGNVIKEYKSKANNTKAIAFCRDVEHSKKVANQFNSNNIRAAHIDGEMTDFKRDKIISDFKNGFIKVVTNVDIVSEGLDIPSIETIIMLRSTNSLTNYLQWIGRALRPKEGGKKAIILDHAGNVHTHGLPDDLRNWRLVKNCDTNTSSNSKFKVCPVCDEVHPPFASTCSCGHVFFSVNKLQEVEQELKLHYTSDDFVNKVLCRVNINHATNCWEWKNKVDNITSIRVYHEGKRVLVKRKLYHLRHGYELSKNQIIKNTCGNNKCVNPDHFTLVTTKDISIDVAKNRDEDFYKKNLVKANNERQKKLGKSYRHPSFANATKQPIIVINTETKELLNFESKSAAARFIGCSETLVRKYENSEKLCKGYIVKSSKAF